MPCYTDEWFKRHRDSSRRSAELIAPYVHELIHPASVIDLGCGTGSWLAVLAVEDCVGVDGDWVNRALLEIPVDRFHAFDLIEPYRSERSFDLALSIEVGEHLPVYAADTLIDSLTLLAPVVLFSAAIPHQPGRAHVNGQWPDWWASKFADRGYAAVDCIRPKFWSVQGVRYFHAQNLILYVRREHLAEFGLTETPVPRLVHPTMYEAALRMFPPRETVGWRSLAGFVARMFRLRP